MGSKTLRRVVTAVLSLALAGGVTAAAAAVSTVHSGQSHVSASLVWDPAGPPRR